MALTDSDKERHLRVPLAQWLKTTLLTIGSICVTMLGLMFITFLIGRVMPIDPVLAIVGEQAS